MIIDGLGVSIVGMTKGQHPMKRMSIAEQTLKKQIDLLYHKRADVLQEIGKLQEQETVYTSMIFNLETEQLRLRTIREANSDLRKPKP